MLPVNWEGSEEGMLSYTLSGRLHSGHRLPFPGAADLMSQELLWDWLQCFSAFLGLGSWTRRTTEMDSVFLLTLSLCIYLPSS